MMPPFKSAAVPTRSLIRLADIDREFQLAGKKGAAWEPWEYTFCMDDDLSRAWARAIKAGAIIPHHIQQPGGAWHLWVRLARGWTASRMLALGWRPEPPTAAAVAYRALGRVPMSRKPPSAPPAPATEGVP